MCYCFFLKLPLLRVPGGTLGNSARGNFSVKQVFEPLSLVAPTALMSVDNL